MSAGSAARFEPDDGFEPVAFARVVPVEAVDFGDALKLELAPGTHASWLAARLAALTDTDPRIFTGAIEVEPDGLFIADLLALDGSGRVLAKLQLQAAPDAIALLGVAGDAERAEVARAALRHWLSAAPEALADVEVQVEGEGGIRRYGRRDGALLRD